MVDFRPMNFFETRADLVARAELQDELRHEFNSLTRLITGLGVVMVVSFILRMITRIFIARKFTMTDWMMLPAFGTAVATSAMIFKVCKIGLEIIDLNFKNADLVSDLSLATTVIGFVCGLTTRLTFGFFFLEIFAQRRPQRMFILSAMIITSILTVVIIPVLAIECPAHKLGNSTCPRAYTQTRPYKRTVTWLSFVWSLPLILGDFGFAIIGLWALIKMQMRIREKIPIGAVLAAGIVVGVFSTIRTAYVIKTFIDPTQARLDLIREARWIFLEVAVGIIVANVVFFRPLFSFLVNKRNHQAATPLVETSSTLPKPSRGGQEKRPDFYAIDDITKISHIDGNKDGEL